MHERYIVMRAEHVAGSDGYADVDKALGAAAVKTRSDREPRFVVQVIAEVSADPQPAVVVTRFDEGDTNG